MRRANVTAVIPPRRNSGIRESSLPCKSDEWLKHNYGLAFLRVRGIERVRLHADLTMLGRLSLALARARTDPLAA